MKPIIGDNFIDEKPNWNHIWRIYILDIELITNSTFERVL